MCANRISQKGSFTNFLTILLFKYTPRKTKKKYFFLVCQIIFLSYPYLLFFIFYSLPPTEPLRNYCRRPRPLRSLPSTRSHRPLLPSGRIPPPPPPPQLPTSPPPLKISFSLSLSRIILKRLIF